MSAVLKNRQMQIPGGFKFRLPEIGYQSPPFQSFDYLVSSVLRVVLANPKVAKAKDWPTSYGGVVTWVDRVNADICEKNGWNDYIITSNGPPPPKLPAPATIQRLQAVAGAVKKITHGVEALLEWETSGLPPVDLVVAEGRAAVCAACPQNGRGDLTRWFTIPASEQIRFHMQRVHAMNLKTRLNDKLGVCEACMCPLRLKIFSPTELVKKHLTDDLKAELPKECWMLK